MLATYTYPIAQIEPYIHWLYFWHAWQMPASFASLTAVHDCEACQAAWVASRPPEERAQAREAVHLLHDARQMLRHWHQHDTLSRFALYQALGQDDDILVTTDDGRSLRLPMLRQQGATSRHLALSDFINPRGGDRIGLFATTVSAQLVDAETDPYYHLLAQTLCDRLAEATAERLHQDVRTHWWGYAAGEHLTIAELLQGRYQGIRPAVGYPSLPDQSLNFLLDEAITLSSIGITLTENGAMLPHGSVTGLMLAHPASSYFAIGPVGDDQLADYAQRRGMPLQRLRKFLPSNTDTPQ